GSSRTRTLNRSLQAKVDRHLRKHTHQSATPKWAIGTSSYRHWRSAEATWRRNLSSLRHLPVPSATALSGSSATWTGKPVSSLKSLSNPRKSAPPPAKTSPRSTKSAESSGGQRSNVILTESTIVEIGSSRASRTSCEVIISVLGKPATRSRPLTSTLVSFSLGYAEPILIFISSAVRSPTIRLYARFMYWTIASSSS